MKSQESGKRSGGVDCDAIMSNQTPPDDAPLPAWVDNHFAKISQLAVLLFEAQDLTRSSAGWIKTSALMDYNGPSIPGNFDTHTHMGEIVNTSTFLLLMCMPLSNPAQNGLYTPVTAVTGLTKSEV